jgi:hypothetical protein
MESLLSFLPYLVSICIPSIAAPGFVAEPASELESLSLSISSSKPSDVTLDVAMLKMDLASIFSVATDLLLLMLFKWILVIDVLEEKLCALTAPSFASPNIIAEALYPLLVVAVLHSLSDSPSDVSLMPSPATALMMLSELVSSRTAYPLLEMYFDLVIFCCWSSVKQ